jgi:hypothetical protein
MGKITISRTIGACAELAAIASFTFTLVIWIDILRVAG